jgi:aerobic C4-dicarboxylate transport protein
MARAVGNSIGNCVATVVIAVWERELNLQLAVRVLDSDVVVEARAA